RPCAAARPTKRPAWPPPSRLRSGPGSPPAPCGPRSRRPSPWPRPPPPTPIWRPAPTSARSCCCPKKEKGGKPKPPALSVNRLYSLPAAAAAGRTQGRDLVVHPRIAQVAHIAAHDLAATAIVGVLADLPASP